MNTKVLGKKLVSGVDKNTGEARINSVVYFSYKDDSVEGVATSSVWVGAYCCPPEQIIVGNYYDLQERNNYVVRMTAVKEGDFING